MSTGEIDLVTGGDFVLAARDETRIRSDIFERTGRVREEVLEYLSSQVWHRLDKAKPLMKCALQIDFGDIGDLMKAVETRHDVMHRARRMKEGDLVAINDDAVQELRTRACEFVNLIEAKLADRVPEELES